MLQLTRLWGWRIPLIAALIAAVVLTGCSRSGAGNPSAPSTAAGPVARGTPAGPQSGAFRLGAASAYAAIATRDLTVYADRRGDAAIKAVFPARLPWGSPMSFLVREAYRDAAGRVWLNVFLPSRPNETTGWVRRNQVRLRPLTHQVEVDLSSRTARLLRDGRTVDSWPVGIGRETTPTPTGRFYLTVKLRPPQISVVYGAWALGLSAYSDVLDQFGTGDGQIALHGTDDPADLGRQVSNGCVRLDNGAITTLAEKLPLGTPVTIRA
ncbi:MAG TPA: L,D-transpeptidase family protein [Actinomycetes bacterium]|nr:L,D-transpeptidase family protein [Actinomycetes bacterium]